MASHQAGSVAQPPVPAAKLASAPKASRDWDNEVLKNTVKSLDAANVADLAELVHNLCNVMDQQVCVCTCYS